jgi:thioredoxin reductase (NADPH)
MRETPPSLLETRRAQMFPVLGAADIARLRRFGEMQSFRARSFLLHAGEAAQGLFLILSGEVQVMPHEAPDKPIVTYGPGSFMGELALLSGRPALADAIALSDVEAVLIAPPRLRDVLVQEAELGELIMRALILRRMGLLERGVGGPVIVGRAGNRDVLRLESFLRRNGHPYQKLDPDVDECAHALLQRFELSPPIDLPIVLCVNGELLRNPSEAQLARCIGLSQMIDPKQIYDVAIIGAGPAGLAAAVYAASEGLSVIVLDCRAFGGQAGASARIENYLGFPTGISGMALMGRAYSQAQKFGTEIAIPEEAVQLEEKIVDARRCSVVNLLSGQTVMARTVVIACGAEYRRLDVANLADYEGAYAHYWASPIEARLCAGEEVALVGGGNSAGQAAVYLATTVRKVWMIVRGRSLSTTMSRYLCERIAAQPNIEVCLGTEVVRLEGSDGRLERIRWRRATDEEETRPIRHLFLLIGAVPNTRWLAQSGIGLDAKGFIEAAAFAENGRCPFETSRAGVFAIGDVRSQSVKRVASSVGEGAQVVAAIHAYLADQGLAREDALPQARSAHA